MKSVNPRKLHNELAAAGLPVVSVTSDGAIYYGRELTSEELETAMVIVRDHKPYDRDAARREAYIRAGIDVETLVVALWEKYIEGDDTASAAIQAEREKIKEQIPPSV